MAGIGFSFVLSSHLVLLGDHGVGWQVHVLVLLMVGHVEVVGSHLTKGFVALVAFLLFPIRKFGLDGLLVVH